ncbi:ROK family protein [Candidatus Woesearchaeota archaeon]|nr:ROK family protein [Candidatus Woesearchaeota archaeon]
MRHAIGVDLTSTRIETCLMSDKGRIIDSIRILTEADKGKTRVLDNICSSINIIRDRNRVDIEGIGIGIPGFCNKDGKIVLMPHVPLVNFNLRRFLNKRYSCPVLMDNNANCFALGEYIFGVGKKARVMLGVIVSTGIGCGIVVDGRIFSGSGGGAGEIGHNVFDLSVDKLQVGGNDFEAFCSGPSMVQRYSHAGGKESPHHPNKLFAIKDKASKDVIEAEYKHLGVLLGSMVNVLNPDIIVIGGSLSKALNPRRLKKQIDRFAIPFSAKQVKVVCSQTEDIAGMVGAAALVFNQG